VGWSSGLNGMLPGIQAAMQAPNWYIEILLQSFSEAWGSGKFQTVLRK
jgi:hypothetical protein